MRRSVPVVVVVVGVVGVARRAAPRRHGVCEHCGHASATAGRQLGGLRSGGGFACLFELEAATVDLGEEVVRTWCAVGGAR